MKGIFVLAALAAVLVGLAIGSTVHADRLATEAPIEGIDNQASHNLFYKVEGVGYTLSTLKLVDECSVADDGKVYCTAVLTRDKPPVAVRFYWCEDGDPEGDCTYFERVEGDQWCNYVINRLGVPRSEVKETGCVWGIGHIYVFTIRLNAGGQVEDIDYTHERQINPDTGKPWPYTRIWVNLDRECLRKMREMARTGEYGPVEECAGSRWYKPPRGSIVLVE